jgi:hypothetical protein
MLDLTKAYSGSNEQHEAGKENTEEENAEKAHPTKAELKIVAKARKVVEDGGDEDIMKAIENSKCLDENEEIIEEEPDFIEDREVWEHATHLVKPVDKSSLLVAAHVYDILGGEFKPPEEEIDLTEEE